MGICKSFVENDVPRFFHSCQTYIKTYKALLEALAIYSISGEAQTVVGVRKEEL